MRSAAFLVIILVIASACSGFDPDTPWTLSSGPEDEPTPIPEGIEIIEHEPVPIEGRTEQIVLSEDLVLKRGSVPFFRLSDIDADESGNMFVFDGGNQNIVVFDRAGTFLRTIGRPGQGPGEITLGGDIAVTAGNVLHAGRNRITVWSAAGELLRAQNLPAISRLTGSIEGTEQGTFVGLVRRPGRGGGSDLAVVGVEPATGEDRRIALLPANRSLMVIRGSRAKNTGIPRPISDFATARTGEVYVTAGSDYDIVAYGADGTPRWALQVPWSRVPLTDADIAAALQRVMAASDVGPGMSNVRRSDVQWPESMPALVGSMTHLWERLEPLQVDGHGHLYVFPFIPDSWDRPEQPVDVYSPDGEHLFSGMIPMIRWESARGDYVYGIYRDPDTEEFTAVRYRLIEPF